MTIEPLLPTLHGLAQAFTSSNTALDAFQKVFDMTLFEKITEETNRYATQKQETHPDPTWTPTYTEEIKAFIGMHIIMGLVRYPRYHLYWIQDDYFANYGIKNTITRRRFQALEQYLHINDISKMPKKGAPDYEPLYRIRPMMQGTFPGSIYACS